MAAHQASQKKSERKQLIVVKWSDPAYVGKEQAVPLRCVVGNTGKLVQGQEIEVKFGKSAAARCWKAVYLRHVQIVSDQPKKKTAKQKGKKKKTKTEKVATNDDEVRHLCV